VTAIFCRVICGRAAPKETLTDTEQTANLNSWQLQHQAPRLKLSKTVVAITQHLAPMHTAAHLCTCDPAMQAVGTRHRCSKRLHKHMCPRGHTRAGIARRSNFHLL
jgi:hypothetical protein